ARHWRRGRSGGNKRFRPSSLACVQNTTLIQIQSALRLAGRESSSIRRWLQWLGGLMLNYLACGAWALVALLLFANIAQRSLPAIISDHREVLESQPIPKHTLTTMPKPVAGLVVGILSTQPIPQSESTQSIAPSGHPTVQSEPKRPVAQSESTQPTTTIQSESTQPSVQSEAARAIQPESTQPLAQSELEVLGSITLTPPAAKVKAQP